MSTEVLQEKFLNIQVCSDEDDVGVLTRRVNEMHECGTRGGWTLTDDPDLAPVECAAHPGRKHYIFDA